MRDPVSIFDMLLVLASFKAVQNGLLTQQRVNRSNTGHSGFHLWPRSKERVPSYGVHPPRFATTALLPRDHVALNTARLERKRERERKGERWGIKWRLVNGLSLPIFLLLKIRQFRRKFVH